jgi:hypothetical protein
LFERKGKSVGGRLARRALMIAVCTGSGSDDGGA